MKRINIYLIILLVFCSVSAPSAGICDSSEKNTSTSLPQPVSGDGHPQYPASARIKTADEQLPEGQPDPGAAAEMPKEGKKTGSTTPLSAEGQFENSQISDTPEDTSSSVSETANDSLFKKEGLAELRAYVDKSSITIGEKVTYTLEIDADNSLEVDFPSYVSGLGGFVVKDFGKDDKKIGRRRSRKRQWYLLDTYTTGSYVIPEQKVTVALGNGQTQVLKSPQIFVEVKSVMDNAGEKSGLRDIKEPLTVSAGIPAALIAALIFTILTAGGIVLRKVYLKKFTARKAEPALTPQEIAFRELERIESLRLIEKEKLKEYYYLVSLALRTYLENRFSLKAPEQTTEEFLESVVRSGKLAGKYINILKEYLNHCDLVKYAKFDPGKSQVKLLIETTRHFIEETAGSEEPRGDETINVRTS